MQIPELSLVVLVGPSGSGKSTFAQRHFKASEIVSSDALRAVVSDNESDQNATNDAFDLLFFIVRKRLKNGLLTVVDATNVHHEDRLKLTNLAREYHVLPIAIIFRIHESVCIARHQLRQDRQFGNNVIVNQISALRRSTRWLKEEGFRYIVNFQSEAEVNAVESIERERLWNNRKFDHGPFDIIGDVHGCFDELLMLLEKLGYTIDNTTDFPKITAPEGRKAVFLGDLVDRGPKSPEVVRLVMQMCTDEQALCVPGNHDMKFLKMLQGRNVQLTHGLELTKAQMEAYPAEFHEQVKLFLDDLVSHYVLDDGKLVVAHAGLREEMQGRGSGAVREFCYYGESTGEIDEFGLPVRYNWAAEYRGRAAVVYGHTPVPTAQWYNNTIDIDTGCVFGGALTALRYPERQLVSVPALKEHSVPKRPLHIPAPNINQQAAFDDVPDISDFLTKMRVELSDGTPIVIREENTIAAMEVMSRFAINPKWLIYLPPTMSPSETSHLEGYLEHPAEAFAYFREQGVQQVICEEKHMGSRAVVIVAKDEAAVLQRFGIKDEGIGVVYTRTGRSFFNEKDLEQRFLQQLKAALDKMGFWDTFQTNWVCLDCELLPWSAKALTLLQQQYAAVGSAARFAAREVRSVLQSNQNPNIDLSAMEVVYAEKQQLAEDFTAAYRRYCWPVSGLEDYRLAPFHILATEGAVHTDKDHRWHMEQIHALCAMDHSLLLATPYHIVQVNDDAACADITAWWEHITAQGGEGMVVKSLDFMPVTADGSSKRIQPMVKCRGREYLRIIYGPEYTLPENLERLRQRGLGAKRNLAWREFQLGIEGLRRFVANEPLRRWHECVFAVLAMESEEVDPRL